MGDTCTWQRLDEICGDPAETIITYGCAHEHIRSEPTCETHLESVDHIFESPYWVCARCYNAPDGREHICHPKIISIEKDKNGSSSQEGN